MVVIFLIFWEPSILFPTVNVPIYITTKCTRVPFSPHLYQHLLFVVLMKTILTDDLSGSSAGKESTCNLSPGSGSSTEEGIGYPFQYSLASLVAQLVKNLPAMREVWVRSLGWEDPLEKGKATHSSILPWRIPGTIHSMGLQWVGKDWATFTFTFKVKKKNEWMNLLHYDYISHIRKELSVVLNSGKFTVDL